MGAGNLIHDYIAGAIGGTAGLVIGHPFDTTKVQLQTREGKAAFRSTLQAMKHISTYGWSHGFFRGLGFPFVSYGVVNSIFFGVYGNTLKALTGGDKAKATYSDIYWAGCMGGTVQLVVGCPVEVIKVILQAQLPNDCTQAGMKYFAGPRACVSWIYRENGMFGFYRGLRTMAVRDIPTFGLYMVLYEYLCDRFPRGVGTTMIVGGVAGIAAWAACFPFDVVKSRLQADVTHSKYTSMLNCAVKMYHEGGMKIFFTGLGVTCLRAFPVNAVTLLFYSNTLRFLETMDASAL